MVTSARARDAAGDIPGMSRLACGVDWARVRASLGTHSGSPRGENRAGGLDEARMSEEGLKEQPTRRHARDWQPFSLQDQAPLGGESEAEGQEAEGAPGGTRATHTGDFKTSTMQLRLPPCH